MISQQCVGSRSARSGLFCAQRSGCFKYDGFNEFPLKSEYFTLLKFENLFGGSKVVIFSQKWPKFQIKTKKGEQIYAVVLNIRTLNAYNFWPDGLIFKLQKVKWSKCQNLSKGSGSRSAKTEGSGSVSQATDMLLSYYTMPVYWYSKQIIKYFCAFLGSWMNFHPWCIVFQTVSGFWKISQYSPLLLDYLHRKLGYLTETVLESSLPADNLKMVCFHRVKSLMFLGDPGY